MRAMFRFVLIALMLLQPLQWAWAAVHITSEAVHAVSHLHTERPVKTLESVAACSLLGDAVDGHGCQDNHTHNTTVLGLGADINPLAQPSQSPQRVRADAAQFDSAWLSSIERPKWMAAR
jgi:hypothetical protein